MKHENRKAIKYQAKANLASKDNNQDSFIKSHSGSRPGSSSNSKPRLKTPEGGFANARGIVVNKRKINHEASNKQYERTNALKRIVQIELEEFHNQLNIKPQTSLGLYFDKLQTFKIQNEMVQSNDNYIGKDVQTEEIEVKEMSMQFPEDLNEKSSTNKMRNNQDLTGFMRRVTAVVETVLEENIQLADLANPKAKDKNPVEEKAKITLPMDLLKVFNAKLLYIS